MSRPLFLGLDSSTQGLKVTVINALSQIKYVGAINYAKDLPSYNTQDGTIPGSNSTFLTPSRMLADAMDLIFSRMKQDGFPLQNVVAISGDGQQHGTVYWKRGASTILENLNASQSLADQLKCAFSFENGPIWMDKSTTKQCRELENHVGGALEMATLTGSRAYERFSANQIFKRYQLYNDDYNNTEHISLVSSYMCSLLLGKYAPIDYSDGAGMNLMNINDLVRRNFTHFAKCSNKINILLFSVLIRFLHNHFIWWGVTGVGT
eukprot:m.85236 g.85236  ORF g.85236 m.85236 type:complete len:264 (+) comp8735_c0_seq2:71-862(+)